MSDAVKKVELLNLRDREDITEQLAGKSIEITLSDDTNLTIEFFERDRDAALSIRAGVGRLLVMPVASNVIKVKVE
jgi:hypothetical protein